MAELSHAGRDALGYVGGGILAVCLIPQLLKLMVTRSARDISLWWAILYCIGMLFTFVYLYLEGATAAWIPLLIEIFGCVLVIGLKLIFDYTRVGAKEQVADADGGANSRHSLKDISHHSRTPGISHAASLDRHTADVLKSTASAVVDWSLHGGSRRSAESPVGRAVLPLDLPLDSPASYSRGGSLYDTHRTDNTHHVCAAQSLGHERT
eukprot:jgi/Chrzof1/14329/UNPLg00602.t1